MTEETVSPSQAALVDPQTLKGFQDLLPADALSQYNVIETIRGVLQRYGFQPIETPALEYLATLVGTGGEDTSKQIFRLKSPEHEDIALRFDLTVPFARVVAQYGEDLKLPFRRYAVAPVWRADKPGPGRFRQFTQFDFDVAGSPSMAVDAEIVRVSLDVMDALGVKGYRVQVNHRKVVDALLAACGIEDEERVKHVLRVVDKLDKVGLDAVRAELGKGRVDDSGDPIKGVGLDAGTIDRICEFLGISGSSRADVFEGIKKMLPDSDLTTAALAEVQEFLHALDALEAPEDKVVFLPSLARGLDYYTGPVFETMLTDAPQFGSVMGGGRYDGLVNRFLGDNIPATGASLGVDRFIAALKGVGLLQQRMTTTEVFITVMDPELQKDYLAIAHDLRMAGVNTEVFFGDGPTGLRKQLALANTRGYLVAIIMGSDEAKAGTVSIKNLEAGMAARADIEDRAEYEAKGKAGQVTVPRTEAVATVLKMIGRDGQ